MSTTVAIPSKLFRAMRKDEAGRPVCGSAGSMLGVRPNVDIPNDGTGAVKPGTGGLSITPDDPAHLPPHVRPPRLGGKGRLPIFEILRGAIGSSLTFRADPDHPVTHGFVEPAKVMVLADYQLALCNTGSSWKEVP